MPPLMMMQPKTGEQHDEAFQEIRELFTYSPWDEEQAKSGDEVRESLIVAFDTVLQHVPPSPTRTRALNHLIDARMLANAAITHRGKY